MPIYEYECSACGHRFEKLIRPSSTTPAAALACVSCGGAELRQLLSSFAVDSASTRQSNRDHGRRVAQKDLTEQKVADREALNHHYGEHHHD